MGAGIEVLVQFSPEFSPQNLTDKHLRDAEPSPDFMLRGDARLCQSADGVHFLWRQFNHPVAHTYRKASVPSRVRAVFRAGRPSQIVGGVVRSITVPMGRLMQRSRLGAVKCRANKLVNVAMEVFLPAVHNAAKSDADVPPKRAAAQDTTSIKLMTRHSRKASDAPQATDLVGPALDGTPFFVRDIGGVSQGDLPIGRGGQGPVRASNSTGSTNLTRIAADAAAD